MTKSQNNNSRNLTHSLLQIAVFKQFFKSIQYNSAFIKAYKYVREIEKHKATAERAMQFVFKLSATAENTPLSGDSFRASAESFPPTAGTLPATADYTPTKCGSDSADYNESFLFIKSEYQVNHHIFNFLIF